LWRRGVRFHFAADAAHTGIYTSWRDKLQVTPDGVEQGIARENLALMSRHVFKQTEFQRGGADFSAADKDLHGGRVDHNVSSHRRGPRALARRQRFFDSADELPTCARKDQVFERACISETSIFSEPAVGQQKHGNRGEVLAVLDFFS